MEPVAGAHLSNRQMRQFLDVQRHCHEGGEEEDPLHEGDHVVLGDQRPEDAEVGGEEQAVADHQQDADGFRLGDAVGMDADGVENQEDDTYEAEGYAAGLLQGDGFLQGDGGDEHGEDGCGGGDDGGVQGCSELTRLQIGQLGKQEAQHGGDEDTAKVLERHLLLGQKQGDEPKKDAGSHRTEAEQTQRADQMGIGQLFADDDVESEDGVGKEYAEVSDQFRGLFHVRKDNKKSRHR